jgi:hypothetical protein
MNRISIPAIAIGAMVLTNSAGFFASAGSANGGSDQSRSVVKAGDRAPVLPG